MIRFFFLSALFVLGGCATTPDISTVITDESHERWSLRQQQLATLNNWQIRGRVALFVNDDVYNLGLDWTLNENHSILKLEAALGQGMIRLERTGTTVTLLTSEGGAFFGQNAEQVLRQSTGWTIPVKGLESWIKGINHDQSDYIPDIDSVGRASSLLQDEWRINFFQYKKPQNSEPLNHELPRKIYMKRQNLALKIVIDQWQAQQNTTPSELFPNFGD